VLDPKSRHMVIDITINDIPAVALVDPGTIGSNMMSSDFAVTHNIPIYELEEPIQVALALKGSKGASSYYAKAIAKVGEQEVETTFVLVTMDGDWNIILGEPALRNLGTILDTVNKTITVGHGSGAKHTRIKSYMHKPRNK